MGDLDSIVIRAQMKGKWGSHTLREMLQGGEASQVAEWFLSRVVDTVGLEEGVAITEENIQSMVTLLEYIGITIHRIKEA